MLTGAFNRFLNILYPTLCLVCRKPQSDDVIICRDCFYKLKRNVPPFCPHCGRHLKNTCCLYCKNLKFYFDRAYSPCRYTEANAELIHQLKYKGKTKIAKILSGILIKFIKDLSLLTNNQELIVPVPLHKARLSEREFNQSELLSLNIAEEFKLKHSSRNLIRLIHNKPQALLGQKERFKNIHGAFKVRDKEEFYGKDIFLVDDVLTTGATCSEAARTLKEAGARNIFVLTFAIT